MNHNDELREEDFAEAKRQEDERSHTPEPEEGLGAYERAQMEAIAPLEKWNWTWDERDGAYVTCVKCPECGESWRYHCNALDDFFCASCDFELDEPGKLPIPASL
ncbi:hypothetical protein [Agrobacterium tumefaciens]|uniref:hypothetical protein n=1 Tax=Agrobacterium tumefaciens TaxID=358 RepID=UPI0015720B9D|nr:hypothetical protein [Agrobacterium tumefaciens]NTB05860.1 hypothetical protein [Agrobacterium tumefaciens]